MSMTNNQQPTRMNRAIGLAGAAMVAVLFAACAMDEDVESEYPDSTLREDGEVDLDREPTSESAESAIVEPDTELPEGMPDDAQAAGGCSYVEWCNAPGTDGTVCRQQGCDWYGAFEECWRESVRICGSGLCINGRWVLKLRDGSTYVMGRGCN